MPLLFDPGSGWEYGIGLDLVGKVIEEVTAEDLESYFRRHILDPLGMRDTGFLLRNDMARRLVGTHMRGPDGNRSRSASSPWRKRSFTLAAQGSSPPRLTMSLLLVCCWQAARSTASKCSSLETVKLMARNAIGDLNVAMVRSNNPALALEVETFPGQVKKWRLTFLINTKDIAGFRSAGSLTWGGVHNTYFWIDLEKRITAVALMQILPIGDPHVKETMIGFERALCTAIASIA